MQRPASIHRCRRLVAVPRTPVPRSGRPHRPTTRLTCGDGQRQQRCGCAAGRASPSRPDSECAVCCRAQRRKDSIGAAWAWTRRGGQKRPAPAPPRSGAADGVLCDFCAKLREPQVAWRPWPARHVVSALVSSLLCGPWVTASIRPSSGRFKGVLLRPRRLPVPNRSLMEGRRRRAACPIEAWTLQAAFSRIFMSIHGAEQAPDTLQASLD